MAIATARTDKSRRMPEGLHRLLIAKSRVRAPPGPSLGPVAQLVEQEMSFQSWSPRTRLPTQRECRPGLHLQNDVPANSRPDAEARPGECRRDYIHTLVAGSTPAGLRPVAQWESMRMSRQKLVAGNFIAKAAGMPTATTSLPRCRDQFLVPPPSQGSANAGRTTWVERPREREAGGLSPPPGNRCSSETCPPSLVAGPRGPRLPRGSGSLEV